jgi:hypothetical protein
MGGDGSAARNSTGASMTVDVLSTGYRNCGRVPGHRFRESSAFAPASIGGDVFPSTLPASRKALQRHAGARHSPCGSPGHDAYCSHSHAPGDGEPRSCVRRCSFSAEPATVHCRRTPEHDAGFTRGRRCIRDCMWTLPEIPGQFGGLAVSESCATIREWRLAAANNWPSWRTNWRP